MKEIRTIFMGTPNFAVPILEHLYTNEYNIISVFTAPDKPVGRKQILTPSPIKSEAIRLSLPVYQPKTLKSNDVVEYIKNLRPDLIVVAAYGYILPQQILEFPKYGAINVHASILPKYRGAAPIQWAILNGESITGVTIMLMDKGVDTGDILSFKEVNIDITDTTETLSEKLSHLGAELLISTLKDYIQGKIIPKKQPQEGISYAPMIKKSDGHINWSRSANEIYNFIRAMTPWPSAYTIFRNKLLKIIWGHPINITEQYKDIGQIINISKNNFTVSCAQGALLVEKVQPEGSKIMTSSDFINGYKLNIGEVFK